MPELTQSRRAVLGTIASGVAVGSLGVAGSASASESRRCNSSPDFVIEGENGAKQSSVYWCEIDRIAHATAVQHGEEIYLNGASSIGMAVLLHERGHNLGYYHGDGGVMYAQDSHEPSDHDLDTPLHETTIDIARKSDGFRVLNWTTDDVFFLIDEFNRGRIGAEDVFMGINRWNNGSSPDIYYTHNYDDMGNHDRAGEAHCFYGCEGRWIFGCQS